MIGTRHKMDKPERGSIGTRHRMDKPETQQTRDTGSIEKKERMDNPETQAVLKQDAEWTYQRNVCPFCVLSQYCLYPWFVHYVSCLNTACVFDLSINCLLSILHVSLPEEALRKDREWTNQIHREY
jgi:hypothetical protein